MDLAQLASANGAAVMALPVLQPAVSAGNGEKPRNFADFLPVPGLVAQADPGGNLPQLSPADALPPGGTAPLMVGEDTQPGKDLPHPAMVRQPDGKSLLPGPEVPDGPAPLDAVERASDTPVSSDEAVPVGSETPEQLAPLPAVAAPSHPPLVLLTWFPAPAPQAAPQTPSTPPAEPERSARGGARREPARLISTEQIGALAPEETPRGPHGVIATQERADEAAPATPFRINIQPDQSVTPLPTPAPDVPRQNASSGSGAPPAPAHHQIELLIDNLAQARETGRSARGELLLRHAEFGSVTIQIDGVQGDLRATLASRDPGFAPAAQAALAVAQTADSAGSQPRQQDHAAAGGQPRDAAFAGQGEQRGSGGMQGEARQTRHPVIPARNGTKGNTDAPERHRPGGLFA